MTCNPELDAQSWEYMMEKFFRVPSLPLGALSDSVSLEFLRFHTCCVEFALLVRGYSQAWLANSAQGLEEPLSKINLGYLILGSLGHAVS